MEREWREIVVHSYLGQTFFLVGKKMSFVLTDLSKRRKISRQKSRFRAFIAFSCLGRSLGGTIPYMFKGMKDAPRYTHIYPSTTTKELGYFLCYLVDYNSVKTHLYIELQYI